MSLPPLGVQAIVLGDKYDIESPAVLDRIAKCGLAGVECGVKDPKGFRKMLDDRGLRHIGPHTGPKGLMDIKPIVESMGILGSRDICSSGLLEWNERTLDDYRRAIDVLNEAGRRLREHGIRLHYHNHDFEFETVGDGKTGMDLLFAGLDAAAVDFCIDVGVGDQGAAGPGEIPAGPQAPRGLPAPQGFQRRRLDRVGAGKGEPRGRRRQDAATRGRPLGRHRAGQQPH